MRAVRTCLVLLVAVLGGPLPLPNTAWAAPTPSRVATIAAAWRSSPVYVDPLFRDALPATDEARVAAAIRADQPQVFVVVLPLTDNDESQNNWRYELYQLFEANDHRKGIYLLTDGGAFFVQEEFGYYAGHGPQLDATAPLADRLIVAASAAVTGAEPDSSPIRPEEPHVPHPEATTSPVGAVLGGTLAGLAVGALAYWALIWVVGLVRIAIGLPFRWSAAAMGPPPNPVKGTAKRTPGRKAKDTSTIRSTGGRKKHG